MCFYFTVFWLRLLLLLSICHKQMCFPPRWNGLSGYLYLWQPFSAVSLTLFVLFCQSHLCIGSPLTLLVVFSLIASSAACYALFLLQCPLSPFAECFISLLFESQHESPLWRSSFPLQAIFIKKLCFLIYLPAGWRVFKSLTMKTNTECTSAMCLDRCYNPQKCTVMAPCLQLQATYSPEMLLEFAKFCPDVWFPTERCNHTSCYMLYFSELL